MLSSFSCASWSSVCLLWRNVCLGLLPIFKLGYVSFYCWVVKVLYVFWIEVPYHIYDLQMFSPILWVVFSLSWLCSLKHKSFKVLWSPTYLFFSFVTCTCGIVSKNALPNSRLWRIIPFFAKLSFNRPFFFFLMNSRGLLCQPFDSDLPTTYFHLLSHYFCITLIQQDFD